MADNYSLARLPIGWLSDLQQWRKECVQVCPRELTQGLRLVTEFYVNA